MNDTELSALLVEQERELLEQLAEPIALESMADQLLQAESELISHLADPVCS